MSVEMTARSSIVREYMAVEMTASSIVREYDENYVRNQKNYKLKFYAIIPGNEHSSGLIKDCDSFYEAIKCAYKFKEPFISFSCQKCEIKWDLRRRFMLLHNADVILQSQTPNLDFKPVQYAPNSNKWLAPRRIISLLWLDDWEGTDICEHWNSPL